MQIKSISLNPVPAIFIDTCVPSPQSIRIFLPLKFKIVDDKLLNGIGIPPPHPNKHISTIP